MGQLLNLGFKNVCNNGNLGNTPNLTPAEIYDLILKQGGLPQYEIRYSSYAGTFVQSQAFAVGNVFNRNIFSSTGAATMFDSIYLNNLPEDSIISIKLIRGVSNATIINSTLNLQKNLIDNNSFDNFWNSTNNNSFDNVKIYIFSKNDLKEFTNIIYSHNSPGNSYLSITINIYSITNQ